MAGRFLVGWCVGHAQVSADDVDDGLPMVGVVACEAFQGVQGGEADGGFVRAELVGGRGVQGGDPSFGRVVVAQRGGDLLVALPTECQH